MSGHHDHGGGTGRTVVFNLTVNLVLTAAKWLAFGLTGSPSLFGEAAHSTADSMNPILLWIGHRRGERPASRRHPFGHGRETFFWSLIAALVMLTVGSFLTAWHGIDTIVTGRAPDYSPWSLGIMIFALAAESCTFTLAWLRLRKEQGEGIVGKIRGSRNTVLLGILLENGVDTLAVILALGGFGLFLLTGNPLWDAVFSLLIAATLACSSVFLIGRSRSLISGETAPETAIEAIRAAAAGCPSVREVLSVSAAAAGPERFVCRLRLRLDGEALNRRWGDGPAGSLAYAEEPVRWTVKAVARECEAVRAAVRLAVPEAADVDIELAP